MQSPVNGHYCPNCNHMMIILNVGGILDLCPKSSAVNNHFPHHHQSPTNAYSKRDNKATKKEDMSKSEMESDQWSLYSEGISYEETDSDYNDNSYNSIDDQVTMHTCRQCCTVGHDELVIPKLHNWSLSSNNEHTTVCRYCREEVNNSYHDHHLVTYWRKHQFKDRQQGLCYQQGKRYRPEETRQFMDYNFSVNCIPVEETINSS